jgi:polyisoprenyl-phosphate glycosyltransferase
MHKNLKSLSIVLPCHNEEDVILDSYNKIIDIINPMLGEYISCYEFVIVNNGSTDASIQEMLKIVSIDENVFICDLRRNFGYQGSITAGLYHASKDMVISMDADLQDDPTKILDMIKEHYKGFDLVLGVRSNRKSDSIIKRMFANIFYFLTQKINKETIPHHGDFRLMSKELVEDFKLFKERNRYLRGMILSLDSQYSVVEYSRQPRIKGKTKFNVIQLFELAIDGITSFSITPVRFITLFGILMLFVSIFFITYILIQKLYFGVTVEGWAFTAIAICMFGGINSFFIGIVGEYVGKSYVEAKERPLFTVRKFISQKDL